MKFRISKFGKTDEIFLFGEFRFRMLNIWHIDAQLRGRLCATQLLQLAMKRRGELARAALCSVQVLGRTILMMSE